MAIRDNLLKFEGSVYIGPLNLTTGDFEGYYADPIECRIFEQSREDGEVTELKSKQRGRYDQLIDSEETTGTSNLAVEFLEVPPSILAILFAGTLTTFTQTAGTVTDEELTVLALDRWFPLANAHLNDAVAAVIKDEAEAVTYVVTDDYVVDCRQGLIKIPTGSGIAVNDVINIGYSKLAKTGVTVTGETNLKGRFRIRFDGKNRYTEKDTVGEVYDVSLKSTEAVDMLSAEPITAKLEGPMITPTGETKPYYWRVYN